MAVIYKLHGPFIATLESSILAIAVEYRRFPKVFGEKTMSEYVYIVSVLSILLTFFLAQNPARQAQTGVMIGQLLRVDGTPASGVRIAVTPVPDPKDPAPPG